MNITLIGTGNMGSAFARQLFAAGHQVRVTGRDLAKARALAAQFDGVEACEPQQALAGNDVVIVATAYDDAVAALKSLGSLDGKIIIDITNPLTADYMGLSIGHSTSAAEEIARAIPGAEVVKGFNTLFAQVLAAGPVFAGDAVGTVFVASDSERARQTAQALAHSLGWHTLDAGGLSNARYLEALAGLNIYLGYGAGLGTQIAPAWLSR